MSAASTRVRQADGGWLLSRDLRDEPRLTSLRLAQHHIAAHRTWGVSAGLHVEPDAGRYSVGPGFAIDRCGRVAVLACATPIDPAGAGFAGGPAAVVLTVRGDGPAAKVRLREPGSLHPADIPLAVVDAGGAVREGDGDRQWLRRPGPARTLGGIVPRGAALLADQPFATPWGWRVHVDLTAHRLVSVPAVVATAAALPPRTVTGRVAGAVRSIPVAGTAIQVDTVTLAGFDIVVRHHLAREDLVAVLGAQADTRTAPDVRTVPMPIAWFAVQAADRPLVEQPLEESP
ncbi:hypothetical protein [Microbacterium terricola]|uniref:Uncharacterized protein n=1 Tax=Microbacterium terricola TaxID=344163 RepID=A0ABM8E1E1_9MICO|nr:hypothetical protein [Microbacterium terricola]UYK40722.1 hypothetical protein OAU46_03460 [Microbacterium terricola]BDV31541.1 hypothetical protein Microterr_22010 [Microbacterium terricola]